ncbi:MAG: CBS domain-containing protein [Thermoplasmatota archaeon]
MARLLDLLRTDFAELSPDEELHRVQSWLTGAGGKVPILVERGRLAGLLDENAIASRRLEAGAKLHHFTHAGAALDADSDLETATRRMRELGATYLPILRDAKPLGYVTAVDVLRARGNGPNARAAARETPLLREGDTAGRAQHHLRGRDDALPVVDAKGHIVAALRWTALARLELNAGHGHGRRDAHGENDRMNRDEVRAIAEEPPVLLAPDAPFASVLDAIEKSGYAFVEDTNGAYLGVITATSLLAATS